MRARTIIILGTAAAVCLAAGLLPGQETKSGAQQLADALQQVVETNAQAMEKEDLDKAMDTIHPGSPMYAMTRQSTAKIFEVYDLKYRISSFSLIGADDTYAVARVKQETRKVSGPAFRDNVVDVMHVFRQDAGKWKMWQSAVLEVQLLAEAPAAAQPAK